MMRSLSVLIAIAACSEPKLQPKVLPPLVAPTPIAEAKEIMARELGFTAGERMVWEIRLRGMAIGRVELTVGENEIRSRFATGTLASAIADVEHELVTVLDRHRPHASTERLELDGKLRQFSTAFAGTASHSLHTAIGVIRSWASRDAAPGFLHVVFADKLVRLELARPSELQGALRVDGKIVGLEQPVALTVWLDAARSITRIELRSNGEQITATPSF